MSKGMRKGLYPWRSQLVGMGVCGGVILGEQYSPWYVSLAMLIVGISLVVLHPLYWFKRGRHGAKAYVGRNERKQERSDGVMSRWDHMKNFSATAMRIRWARVLQPDRELTWWQIFREPVTGYAVCLGYSNYGKKWLPLNSVVSRISAARSGKSQALMCRILDHEGPVVATSTRGELITQTGQLREEQGPTYIFNAGQVGHHVSNLKWSVLSGCRDMDTAQRRARDLVGPLEKGDKGNWDGKAIDVLGPLLYLAAHLGFGMRAVEKWIAVGSVDDAKDLYFRYIAPKMKETPEGKYALGGLELFYNTNDRTRTSITSSLGPVLSWLGNGATNALGNSPNCDFDVERDLLDANATIYMLGGQERGVAPLMRALAAEIVYQASRVAERRPGGKLAPTLLMALDEVPLTCPGPLDKWVLDMGGRGIVIDLIVQQRAGLDQIWGEEGRDVILGNSLAILFGAGCNSRKVAEDYAALAGQRTEWRETRDDRGKVTSRSEVEVSVLDPGKLMALQTGESVFFCRGRIDIIKTPQAEKRKDVKRLIGREAMIGRLHEHSRKVQEQFRRDLEDGRV